MVDKPEESQHLRLVCPEKLIREILHESQSDIHDGETYQELPEILHHILLGREHQEAESHHRHGEQCDIDRESE